MKCNQYIGPQDLSGRRFGRWIVVSLVRKNKRVFWKCRCDCGQTGVVRVDSLNNGRSSSCGCLDAEVTAMGDKARVHGMSGKQFYRSWNAMKYRCGNPKATNYKYYGGRGIKVCSRWNKFINFQKDMLSSWKSGLTIERINVNGNYSPGNCTWITQSQQVYNRRCVG